MTSRAARSLSSRLGKLKSAREGAAMAEFIIAFPILALSYLCFLQMAQVYTACVVMRHSATILARYASVSFPTKYIPEKNDHARSDGGKNADWREAVTDALGPWKDVITIKDADVQAQSAVNDPWGDLEAKVDFEYRCHVPVAKLIVCKNAIISRSVKVTSTLNGARYIL